MPYETIMDEIFEKLLKYGMFLGAIFQLVCIAAVIILPEQEKVPQVSIRVLHFIFT